MASKKARAKKEEFHAGWQTPLKWLESWPRTRHQDRESANSWKGSLTDYRQKLDDELRRLGVLSAIVSSSYDTPQQHLETGVVVYYSRKEIDFSWQDTFDLVGVVPTPEQINTRYRALSKMVHPDVETRDLERFIFLTQQRDNAIAWVTGTYHRPHESAIACDSWKEIRWNVYALAEILRSIRRIDDMGGSPVVDAIMDKGFAHKLITAGGPSAKKA